MLWGHYTIIYIKCLARMIRSGLNNGVVSWWLIRGSHGLVRRYNMVDDSVVWFLIDGDIFVENSRLCVFYEWARSYLPLKINHTILTLTCILVQRTALTDWYGQKPEYNYGQWDNIWHMTTICIYLLGSCWGVKPKHVCDTYDWEKRVMATERLYEKLQWADLWMSIFFPYTCNCVWNDGV